MGGDAGQFRYNPITGRPESITIDRTLSPEKTAMVHAHENGHAIDFIAGQIPTKGLTREEFQPLYNTMNNANRARGGLEAAPWGKPATPKSLGYEGAEIPREYVAEAIRAYQTNPNYIKSVAPRVAARIRQYVNSHPELSKIIQFNTIGGFSALPFLNQPPSEQ
jgi:hypothetical protein